MRLMEKKRELVRRSDVDALIDDIAGVTLTALSSLPARCAPRGDLAIRRSIEQVGLGQRADELFPPWRYGQRHINGNPIQGVTVASFGGHFLLD